MTIDNGDRQLPRESALLKALEQNWESARYYESARWKYTYAYSAALGAVLLYIIGKSWNIVNILNNQPAIFFLAILFLLLALAGVASFLQLLHANMEYKNHIRAIEFIASELSLNDGIKEYRISKEEGKEDRPRSRYTYMALPLLLKIRRGISFKVMTGLGISISVYISFFLFLVPVWPVYLILCFATLFAIAVFYLLHRYWKKKEQAAEKELKERDPLNLVSTADDS